jgi:DNA-binding response OmpR family regulator
MKDGTTMNTALIADDDTDLRELVAFKLHQHGWEIRSAADGEEALEMLLSDPPDVAVLDIMMSKLSGLELCREIRVHPETAGVAVLLLTAKAQQADIERGFQVGADDYLVKPFSPRELVARLELLASVARG